MLELHDVRLPGKTGRFVVAIACYFDLSGVARTYIEHVYRVGERERAAGIQWQDMGGLLLLPAMIDTHCHPREPGDGTSENAATFISAALAGGVCV